ncbi:hypothetical protein ACW185_10075 [Limosilactobacillus fermentum]
MIADEIYSELISKPVTTLPLPPTYRAKPGLKRLSKSHAMTGYRIGFVAGPAELMKVCFDGAL